MKNLNNSSSQVGTHLYVYTSASFLNASIYKLQTVCIHGKYSHLWTIHLKQTINLPTVTQTLKKRSLTDASTAQFYLSYSQKSETTLIVRLVKN